MLHYPRNLQATFYGVDVPSAPQRGCGCLVIVCGGAGSATHSPRDIIALDEIGMDLAKSIEFKHALIYLVQYCFRCLNAETLNLSYPRGLLHPRHHNRILF